ncbi:helix-turn-helix transcriptional regulator [Streptacidiphilus sp. P02-A3a]|uniref:helix-turn-helix transcriptional regulator n=1 Tax=Streptacidiphilus sp. P02-A3a TaxID=2704468 RepID=UPI0015FCFBA8|nr:helix-turn-helix transcriptional regulator [Streptacidiphilus sp. P02-A3a]QMU68776.1 helix-turn-helix domain-containing protein [Streptacidiphilus sp. P02-A3a]
MDRAQLADFLRRSRSRLTPTDVGLPAGARRRTPGLRREEVAQLAGMSADYYTRLEQRRGPHPSGQLLAALARALRLTDDERDHLYHLAGQVPPLAVGCADEHVRPGLLLILDRLYDTPAQVISDLGDILAQNALAAALFGDVSGQSPMERNIVWRWFARPESRALFLPEIHDRLGQLHVAQLRAVVATYPDDGRAAALVRQLLSVSAQFAELWADHDVALRRGDTKTVLHPVVGAIELDCEAMLGTRHRQRLIVHTARPGSVAQERLELLRVVGLQDLRSPDPDPRAAVG